MDFETHYTHSSAFLQRARFIIFPCRFVGETMTILRWAFDLSQVSNASRIIRANTPTHLREQLCSDSVTVQFSTLGQRIRLPLTNLFQRGSLQCVHPSRYSSRPYPSIWPLDFWPFVGPLIPLPHIRIKSGQVNWIMRFYVELRRSVLILLSGHICSLPVESVRVNNPQFRLGFLDFRHRWRLFGVVENRMGASDTEGLT